MSAMSDVESPRCWRMRAPSASLDTCARKRVRLPRALWRDAAMRASSPASLPRHPNEDRPAARRARAARFAGMPVRPHPCSRRPHPSHTQPAMAAIASFQGVKVVTKARAAKVNVRAAPVASLQKASKVRAAATGRAAARGRCRGSKKRGARLASVCRGWGSVGGAGCRASGLPIGCRAPLHAAARLIGAAAAGRRARGARLGGWHRPSCSPVCCAPVTRCAAALLASDVPPLARPWWPAPLPCWWP